MLMWLLNTIRDRHTFRRALNKGFGTLNTRYHETFEKSYKSKLHHTDITLTTSALLYIAFIVLVKHMSDGRIPVALTTFA